MFTIIMLQYYALYIQFKNNKIIDNKQMFRGSAYSIEPDIQQIPRQQLHQQQIRVALMGVSDVGKSSMLACIENQKFREDIPYTKGVQIRFKKLRIHRYAVSLYVWDGPGDRIGQFIQQGQLNTMDGIIEVFDITDKQTLYQLQQLHHQLKKIYNKIGKNLCAVLVGNKAQEMDQGSSTHSNNDNVKQTDYLAEKFAKRQQLLYLKASAKKNSSVKDSFIQLIKQVLVSRSKDKTSRSMNSDDEAIINSQPNNNNSSFSNKNDGLSGCHCCRSLKLSCSIF